MKIELSKNITPTREEDLEFSGSKRKDEITQLDPQNIAPTEKTEDKVIGSRTSRIFYGIVLNCGILMVSLGTGTGFLIAPLQVASFALIPLNKKEVDKIKARFTEAPRINDSLLTSENNNKDLLLTSENNNKDSLLTSENKTRDLLLTMKKEDLTEPTVVNITELKETFKEEGSQIIIKNLKSIKPLTQVSFNELVYKDKNSLFENRLNSLEKSKVNSNNLLSEKSEFGGFNKLTTSSEKSEVNFSSSSLENSEFGGFDKITTSSDNSEVFLMPNKNNKNNIGSGRDNSSL